MALSRLSELHIRAPQPLSDLSAANLAKNGESSGLELPACTNSAAGTVLDTIELQIVEALRQRPEVHKRVLQSSCVALGSSHDLLAAVTAQGGNDVRSQLRNILTTVARHASAMLGQQKANGAGQQSGSEWGWDCTQKRAVSARQVSRAGDASEAALLLCQQLSKALALCSVTRRCALLNPSASIDMQHLDRNQHTQTATVMKPYIREVKFRLKYALTSQQLSGLSL